MTIAVETTPVRPAVSAKGKIALDELLAERVDSGLIPPTTFGATSVDGPIYFATRGERVLGEPEKGDVDDKTSELTASASALGMGQRCCGEL